MNSLFAIILLGVTFSQSLPYQPAEAFVSIRGNVSNSSDPALTTPRSVVGMVKVGATNPTEIEISNQCEIHLSAHFTKDKREVVVEVIHSHAAYADFANPIGVLEYEVAFDKCKVVGKFSWDQSRKLERAVDIFLGDERYDPIQDQYLAFDWSADQWSRHKELKVIPGRKYILDFDYIIPANSFNVDFVKLKLSQYMDGLKFWKQDEDKLLEIPLNINGRWNHFRKIITTDKNNVLMIAFNSVVKEYGKESACALYLRRATITPLLQSDLVHGP